MTIKRPIIRICVNNIKIMKVKKNGITKKVKQKLITTFLIIDMGLISFYLSPKIKINCK